MPDRHCWIHCLAASESRTGHRVWPAAAGYDLIGPGLLRCGLIARKGPRGIRRSIGGVW